MIIFRTWYIARDGARSFRTVLWIDLDHLGGVPASKHEAAPYVAMEPAECLEPLNLVIKKDDTDDSGPVIGKRIAEATIDEEKDAVLAAEDSAIEDNMAILQDAVKSAESGGLPTADHKLLTALYMSSLMQMSSLSAPRGIAPPPYGANQQQQSFVQLLAMVEARHRMWQQMNWPLPQNFLRSPLTLPPTAPPYFDGATTTPTPAPTPNLTDQLSQNTAPTYPLSCAKPEPLNPEAKQSYFNKRYTRLMREGMFT